MLCITIEEFKKKKIEQFFDDQKLADIRCHKLSHTSPDQKLADRNYNYKQIYVAIN